MHGVNNVNMIIYLFIYSRHLQRFWGASGDFWQAQWDRLLDVIGEDPFTLWAYGRYIPRMMKCKFVSQKMYQTYILNEFLLSYTEYELIL